MKRNLLKLNNEKAAKCSLFCYNKLGGYIYGTIIGDLAGSIYEYEQLKE
jgi:hypothetical protein